MSRATPSTHNSRSMSQHDRTCCRHDPVANGPKGDVNGRDHGPYGVRDHLGNAPDD